MKPVDIERITGEFLHQLGSRLRESRGVRYAGHISVYTRPKDLIRALNFDEEGNLSSSNVDDTVSKFEDAIDRAVSGEHMHWGVQIQENLPEIMNEKFRAEVIGEFRKTLQDYNVDQRFTGVKGEVMEAPHLELGKDPSFSYRVPLSGLVEVGLCDRYLISPSLLLQISGNGYDLSSFLRGFGNGAVLLEKESQIEFNLSTSPNIYTSPFSLDSMRTYAYHYLNEGSDLELPDEYEDISGEIESIGRTKGRKSKELKRRERDLEDQRDLIYRTSFLEQAGQDWVETLPYTMSCFGHRSSEDDGITPGLKNLIRYLTTTVGSQKKLPGQFPGSAGSAPSRRIR